MNNLYAELCSPSFYVDAYISKCGYIWKWVFKEKISQNKVISVDAKFFIISDDYNTERQVQREDHARVQGQERLKK